MTALSLASLVGGALEEMAFFSMARSLLTWNAKSNRRCIYTRTGLTPSRRLSPLAGWNSARNFYSSVFWLREIQGYFFHPRTFSSTVEATGCKNLEFHTHTHTPPHDIASNLWKIFGCTAFMSDDVEHICAGVQRISHQFVPASHRWLRIPLGDSQQLENLLL